MSRRYNFKALDQRTGRLERACTLLEDGERPGIRTREPDPKHPLSRPTVIGMDRAQVIAGMGGEQKLEDQQVKILLGSTAASNFTDPRGIPAFVLSSGGFTLTYTAG